MKDLGLNPYRKSNVLAEMFVRYRRSDYRGLIDEYLSSQGNKISDHTVANGCRPANGHVSGHITANGHAVKRAKEAMD